MDWERAILICCVSILGTSDRKDNTMTSRGLKKWSEIINQRRLTDDEFGKLRNLKVKQQNSHEYSDTYDGNCDHCIKQELLLSQMTFDVVGFEFSPTEKESTEL